MKMTKESFLIYNNWAVLFLNLPDQAALDLMRAICAYELGENYEITDPAAMATYKSILPRLKQDQDKYAEKCKKRSEAAKKKYQKAEEQTDANGCNCMQMDAIGCKSTVLHGDTDTVTETETDTDNLTVIDNSLSTTTLNNHIHTSSSTSANRHECLEVVEQYNTICKSLPKAKTLSKQREKAIKARLRTFTKKEICHAFSIAQSSRFLCGNNNRNWKADLDWIIGTKSGGDQHLAKILEGAYIDSGGTGNWMQDIANEIMGVDSG